MAFRPVLVYTQRSTTIHPNAAACLSLVTPGPPRFYGSILSTCSLLSQLSLLRRRAGPRRILHLEDHPNWNHHDFQQFMRVLETSSCGPTLKVGESFELYMFDIQDKTPERLKSTRRSRRSGDWLSIALEQSGQSLLSRKFNCLRYPMQELELNYPTTWKQREEEDRKKILFSASTGFSKVRHHKGCRRWNTLLSTIKTEAEMKQAKAKSSKGKKRGIDETNLTRRNPRHPHQKLVDKGKDVIRAKKKPSESSLICKETFLMPTPIDSGEYSIAESSPCRSL